MLFPSSTSKKCVEVAGTIRGEAEIEDTDDLIISSLEKILELMATRTGSQRLALLITYKQHTTIYLSVF